MSEYSNFEVQLQFREACQSEDCVSKININDN
jgi:hypothetical protein